MKYVIIAGSALLLSAGVAMAQAPAPAANIAAADRHFAEMAAESSMGEVQAAQLAESKSGSSAVKDFAARMVSDHTQANQQLMQIAGTENISLPAGPGSSDTAAMEKLRKLSGSQFDRSYIQGQVQDHVKAVALFRNEAAHGENPQLKQFAQQTLPILEAHLKMARGLASHTGAQG